MFDPDCLFTAKSSKSLLTRIKSNLAKLCEANGNAVEVLKWTSKFCAEVMDLCKVEMVQIEGMSICETAASLPSEPASPSDNTITDQMKGLSNKLNTYLILFSRPKGTQYNAELLELFSRI